MKIYTVERLDKFDYDFSVELKKCGCFYDKKNALQKAKEVYESMCGEYEDGMARYADEEDEAWKAANDDADNECRIDTENGWTTDMYVHEGNKEIELINYYNGNECITEYIVFEL